MREHQKPRKKVQRRKGKDVLFVRGLPSFDKVHFKAVCALRGVSMNDRILELIRRDVAEWQSEDELYEPDNSGRAQ